MTRSRYVTRREEKKKKNMSQQEVVQRRLIAAGDRRSEVRSADRRAVSAATAEWNQPQHAPLSQLLVLGQLCLNRHAAKRVVTKI